MRTWIMPVAAALFGLAEVAGADAIQKWRTSGGALYFGDHPPAGSTLVETYADSPPAAPAQAPPAPSEEASLSKAAAEGRDIIRRREDARAEQRRADQEREAREAEAAAAAPVYDSGYPWYIATTNLVPCRVGERCFHDPQHNHGHHHHHRPVAPPPATGSWGRPTSSPPFRPAPMPPRASGGSFAASSGRRVVR
ncbi:MAG: hypothetical protein ABW298_14365 [Candidatus Binatia bacterium]